MFKFPIFWSQTSSVCIGCEMSSTFLQLVYAGLLEVIRGFLLIDVSSITSNG